MAVLNMATGTGNSSRPGYGLGGSNAMQALVKRRASQLEPPVEKRLKVPTVPGQGVSQLRALRPVRY